jgi:VCBS repeat-containing protein
LLDTGLHLYQTAPIRVEIPSDPMAGDGALVADGDTLTVDAVTFTFRSPAPGGPAATDIGFYEGETPEILARRIVQAIDAAVAAGSLSDVAALHAGNGVVEFHGAAEVTWIGSLRPYRELPVRIDVSALLPLDEDHFTLADGRHPAVVFEFDNNVALADNAHQRVVVGGDAVSTAENIAEAINRAVEEGLLHGLTASSSGASVLLIPHATTVGSEANDEDGVRFDGVFVPGRATQIVVTVSGGNGMLDAWIDWNNNGRFDPGEQVLINEPVFEGENRLAIITPESIDIDDVPYYTSARFRLSPSGGLASYGLGVGGEVEDYRIRIMTNTAPVATAPIGNLPRLEGAASETFNLAVHFDDDDITNGNGDFLTYSATLLGFASVVSDLDTDGAVHIRLDAKQPGVVGEAIRVLVTESDYGDARGPVVTVDGATISVDLNTNSLNPTTAQQFVDAINAHAQASALVDASIVRGIASTLVTGRDPGSYSPLSLAISIPLEYGLDATELTLSYLPYQNGRAVLIVTATDQASATVSDTVTITVLPVNDPPEFTLGDGSNLTIVLNEDAGPRVVADWATEIRPGPPEAEDELIQVLAFDVTVQDVQSPGAWTMADFFTTPPAIDAATGALTFQVAPNANGDAVIQVILRDDGGTDNGGVDQSAPQTFTISVRAINDPPVLTVQSTQQTTNEDTPLVFSGVYGNSISVFDLDAGEAAVEELRVSLSVLQGELTLSSVAGLTFDAGDGTADLSMTFRGSQSAINAALDGMQYLPRQNYNGSDRLVVVVNDLGNFGFNPANPTVPSPGLEDRRTVNLTVTAVNDPPTLALPQTSYTMSEDTTLPISGIIMGDAADETYAPVTLRVTLTAKYGTITVNSNVAGGVPAGNILNNNSASVRLTGTPAALNATLAHASGVVYRPRLNGNDHNFEDHPYELLTVNVNDLGNVGLGGPKSVEDSVTISVTPVNDPPSITSPGPLLLDEDQTDFYFPLIVTDVDADENPTDPKQAVSVVLRLTDMSGNPLSTAGTLIVRTDVPGGLDPTLGTGNGTLSGNGSHLVTITGSPVKITNTLTNATGLRLLPAQNWNGTLLLVASMEDHGNTGGGPSLSATVTVPIQVQPVNDPPVVTVPVGPFAMDEGPNQSLKIYGIGVTDVDAAATPPGHIVVTLSVPAGHGSLSVVPGVAGGVPSNRIAIIGGGREIRLAGTPEEINKTLALPQGLTYTVPDGDFNNNRAGGDIILTILADDLGRTGSGTVTTDEETIPITVRPINDAPHLTATQTAWELLEGPGSSVTIHGLSVADVDVLETSGGMLKVTLEIPLGAGRLSVMQPSGGVPANRISQVQDAQGRVVRLVLTGTPNELNTTLASGVRYEVPNGDFNRLNYGGLVPLTVTVDDQGYSGRDPANPAQPSPPLVATATLTIDVIPVNDPPTITTPPTQVIQEDRALVFGSGTGNAILVNDVDLHETGGALLKVTLLTTNGTLTLGSSAGLVGLVGNGTAQVDFEADVATTNTALSGLTFQPNPDFNELRGNARVEIRVNDRGATGASPPVADTVGTVSVQVTPVNDPPDIRFNGVSVPPEPIVISHQQNQPLNITAIDILDPDVTETSGGTLRVEFSVTNGRLDVLPGLTGGLSASQITGNGSNLVRLDATPDQINLTLTSEGGFIFTPNVGFSGNAELTIHANDQGYTGAGGVGTDSMTVTITVTAANTPPVAANDPAPSATPYTVDKNSVLQVAGRGVLDNDSDIDSTGPPNYWGRIWVWDGQTSPVNGVYNAVYNTVSEQGVAIAVNADGTFTYDPRSNSALQLLRPGQSVVDTYTYRAVDGGGATSNVATVTITVLGANSPPVAVDDNYTTPDNALLNTSAGGLPSVLANDSDPENDPLQVMVSDSATVSNLGATVTMSSNGHFTYDPRVSPTLAALREGDPSLTDTFHYTVWDGEFTARATVTITVTGANSPPVAVDDRFTTPENTILNISAPGLLINDFDWDSQTITALAATGTSQFGATFQVLEDGSLVYNPTNSSVLRALNDGESKNDTFTYRITDEQGAQATGRVTVTVTGVSDPPYQNQVRNEDVNGDGFVSPIDALILINFINSQGAGTLPPGLSTPPFLDPSGDNAITPLDVIQVINALNAQTSGSGGEGEADEQLSAGGSQWSVGSSQWAVGTGQWAVDSGPSSLVSGHWSLVTGQTAVVAGQGTGNRGQLDDLVEDAYRVSPAAPVVSDDDGESMYGDLHPDLWDLEDALSDIAAELDDVAQQSAADRLFATL